jgi:hypothetical protein
MAVGISPLIHIEIVVHDAEGAYQFLHKVQKRSRKSSQAFWMESSPE